MMPFDWMKFGWDVLWQCLCPSRCVACDEDLAESRQPGALCAECFALCEPAPEDGPALPPNAPHCHCRFVYEGPLATALLRFKWQGRDDLAQPLGQLMVPLLAELTKTYDWLVPVPLHPQRLRRRGFNQATLLAREALRHCPTPRRLRLHPGLLTATRPTAPALRLGRLERFERTRSRFAVAPRAQAQVANRRIVLLDDVITTGATVTACAEALRTAGAVEVTALSLLRVLR